MSPPTDTWALARHRLRDDVVAILLIWAGFAVFVFAMVFVVAAFRPIQVSGWETGSQLPRWFAGGIGVHLSAVYAPLYIAHGYTRREIARQLPVATGGTLALLSVLMTAGYAIERGVYGLAGWPQTLTQSHLYTSPDAYGLVLLEFGLLFTVWATAGALAGAAIYRNPALGVGVVPLSLVMVGLAETVLNPGFFEVVTAIFGFLGLEPEGVSTGAAVSVALGAVAVGAPLTWLLLRDLPLHTQRA